METQKNRVVLDQHWAASASGDLEAEHQIYDDHGCPDGQHHGVSEWQGHP